jgi:hypothetical protein
MEQVHDVEAVGCKRIIFTALVHDANVAVGFTFLIRDHLIEFPHLKRGFVPLIVKA